MDIIHTLKQKIQSKFTSFKFAEVYVNTLELRNGGLDDSYEFMFYIRRFNAGGKGTTYRDTPNMYNIKYIDTKWRAVFKMPTTVSAEDAESALVAYIGSASEITVTASSSDASAVFVSEGNPKDSIIDNFNLVCIDFNLTTQKAFAGCVENICPSLCKTC